MKFKFKIQQYQTDAVQSTVDVFTGQTHATPAGQQYRRDLGVAAKGMLSLGFDSEGGYRNADIVLTKESILDHIHEQQDKWKIPRSATLSKGVGEVNLDIEMETGTGKTYVYIKTMYELYKNYGWSKFIVVVPSIAIREGVAKSFEMLEEHFAGIYGHKARYFIYNSKDLHKLDDFSSSSSLSVMIINVQAFATSLKEGGRSKESRIIYDKRDEFQSRRPIDVIAANRPIIIRDEPQKMEGDVSLKALERFNPLFVLNYSATHRTKHDTIYALDALDAYRKKLVKRIQVKGIEVKNLRGTQAYLYLDSFVLSPDHPPEVRIEMEAKASNGTIRRVIKRLNVNDNLFAESGLAAYKDFVIAEIDPLDVGTVRFTNGVVIHKGEVYGDDNEELVQRVQIRETIYSHLEKEKKLFKKGIKCLSLFFIDKVANYKQYDEDGNELKGRLQEIFEEEYRYLVTDKKELFDEDYREYLDRFPASEIHKGYFSIDKNKRAVDSKVEKKTGLSDDVSAYELILKNKARLLDFDEPTRFIFSHSALREGWDNPNVFQICTLRHTESTTAKRQEIGRGLRLCVNKEGIRMDAEVLKDEVHSINQLTVISNESYASFTDALQKETREYLRDRQVLVSSNLFENQTVKVDNTDYLISDSEASRILIYLEDNGYIDDNGNLTAQYNEDKKSNVLKPLPAKIAKLAPAVHDILNNVFNKHEIEIENANETQVPEPVLNERFFRKEFQDLWKEINHRYVYRVSYDSEKLIRQSVDAINAKLEVTPLRYERISGLQHADEVDQFADKQSKSEIVNTGVVTSLKYDLVGDIAKAAKVTRKTAVEVLKSIMPSKFSMFKTNPEEFIRKVSETIREQKATMIVEHIEYDKLNETYDSDIFTMTGRESWAKALRANKHITDYLTTDSKGEKEFAENLEAAEEVLVYAKLPRSFQIPTPVGNYAPDWAIAINKDDVKHIFFIAETKGNMDELQLRAIERAKIRCAKKLFNSLKPEKIRYEAVDSYKQLRDLLTEPSA